MSNYNKNGSTSSINNISRFKKSSLAVCIMAACSAQAQDTPVVEEELIVRGIRQSLQTSQDLKRDAATVKDVITASDINAFPDKSVAEALQRLSGVNIERFAASDDPDHFSVEGSGVVIRGLTRIRSEFNGRDTFSADGSGGLNFSDVPPELLGSVEVVKNATASMIEGGIAGTVNLNTRKPFDKRERQTAVTLKGSYGDLSEEGSGAVSGLFSNVWDVSSGTVGWLINASFSNLKTRSDGVGLYNYYERSPVLGNALTAAPDSAVFMPPAGSIRTQENDRERLGLTSSLQWANAEEDITVTLEYILSRSNLVWEEHFLEYADQPFAVNTSGWQVIPDEANNRPFNVDGNGVFQSGRISGPYTSAGAREQDGERQLSDLSLKVEFDITDNLVLITDFQMLDATNEIVDNTATLRYSGDSYLDLRGDVPEIQYIDPSFLDLAGPASAEDDQTFWRSFMDHVEDSEGDQKSFAADLEYSFDDGLITAVKGGVRIASRDQTIRRSIYNWGGVSESWAGGGVQSQLRSFIENGDADLLETFEFDNFHRGDVILGNNTFLFPTLDALQDSVELDRRLSEGGYVNANRVNLRDRAGVIEGTPFLPSEISRSDETRKSAYIQVDMSWFPSDSFELRGNLGLRYVDYEWNSSGAVTYADVVSQNASLPPGFIPADELAFGDGGFSESATVPGTDESTVLPSINISAVFNDQFIIRAAASKALFFPNMLDVRAQFVVQENLEFVENDAGETVAVIVERYTGDGGNPTLKPEESDQYDLSFEWYFSEVGSLTTAFFYKEMDEIIRTGPYSRLVTNNGVSRNVFATGEVNSGSGIVKGVEFSYQQTFDFLPAPFDGFGTQFNYTYVDQSGAAVFDPELDLEGDDAAFAAFSNLPLENLSEDTLNFVVFYENDSFDARLAYNWRSSYLLNSRDVIAFAPVYANDTGQLDGSFNYRITDSISAGIELNNILDEVTETQIQFNQEGTLTPRNYFINDRRISLTLRASF